MKKEKKYGVLLLNLGTPDSPSTKDVRKYLSEFLNDPRVIDISPLARWFLVNFIIVPFRAPKSPTRCKRNGTPGNGLLNMINRVALVGKASFGAFFQQRSFANIQKRAFSACTVTKKISIIRNNMPIMKYEIFQLLFIKL